MINSIKNVNKAKEIPKTPFIIIDKVNPTIKRLVIQDIYYEKFRLVELDKGGLFSDAFDSVDDILNKGYEAYDFNIEIIK